MLGMADAQRFICEGARFVRRRAANMRLLDTNSRPGSPGRLIGSHHDMPIKSPCGVRSPNQTDLPAGRVIA
jgi:hypothetical protein